MEQCVNVFKTHTVQKRRIATYRERKHAQGKPTPNLKANYTYPRVHGLVYDPKDGRLNALPVKEFILPHVKELQEIYQVYDAGKDTMDMP